MIVSYETYNIYKDELFSMRDNTRAVTDNNNSSRSQFDLMICDEGHRLKNEKVKVFKALMDLKCRSRIIVTGTPIQNNLGELYSCIRFVYP